MNKRRWYFKKSVPAGKFCLCQLDIAFFQNALEVINFFLHFIFMLLKNVLIHITLEDEAAFAQE